MEAPEDKKMLYRFLGNSGLRVSVLSIGSWITASTHEDEQNTKAVMRAAWDNGVNFFDTAEAYGYGDAETLLGKALAELPCERKDFVVSTKYLYSSHGQNDKMLGAKHLREGVRESLKRMNLEYFDVIFAHRPDCQTPLEETCRSFDQIIRDGRAFYWATSEWSPQKITRAIEICERLGLHKPICDQAQYSLNTRDNFENNLKEVYEDYGYGTTVWSPLAGGILTGKYNNAEKIEGSRYGLTQRRSVDDYYVGMAWNMFWGDAAHTEGQKTKLQEMAELATELGCSQAQLALAWVVVNKDTSTCIFGASKVSQVEANIKSLEIAANWTQETEDKMSDIFKNAPSLDMDFRAMAPRVSRRQFALDLDIKSQLTKVHFPQ